MSKLSDAVLFKAAKHMMAAANNFERATAMAKDGRLIDSHCVGAVGKCQFLVGKAMGGICLLGHRRAPDILHREGAKK
jgi:hypothetical protein